MRKKGVLIIECIDRDDPGSEGHALRHLFNLMGIRSERVSTNSIGNLLYLILNSEYRYVHVATHGSVSKERFRGWWTPKGTGTRKRLDEYELDFGGLSIVSTACKSGHKEFGQYLVDELSCEQYIGPKGSPYFHDSIFFAHIFYYKLFVIDQSFKNAFSSYTDAYKNPHRFSLFRKRR